MITYLVLAVYVIGVFVTGCWFWKDADPIQLARDEDSAAMAGMTFLAFSFAGVVVAVCWPLVGAVAGLGYAIIWPIGKLLGK